MQDRVTRSRVLARSGCADLRIPRKLRGLAYPQHQASAQPRVSCSLLCLQPTTAMASRKRPIETIDLTQDEPARPSSQTCSAPSSATPRAPKQQRMLQQDAVFMDDDAGDYDASQDAPDATQGYNEQQYDYGLFGAMDGKIVGVRYYSGYATVGEVVLCRREPHNQYDRTCD